MDRMSLIGAAVGLCGFFMAGSAVLADSTTVDYAITIDGRMDSRDPNMNFGVGDTAKVVVNGGDESLVRGLLSLPEDVWLVPAEQILQAELHFNLWRNDTGPRAVNLHPLTRGFLEGTGDGEATGDGATWMTYDGVNAWTTPGGDFDESTWVSAGENGNWFVWDLLPLWDNSNLKDFGAILKMDDETWPEGGAMLKAPLYSSDAQISDDLKPFVRLVIVPEPATGAMVLLLTGLAGMRRLRKGS